MIYGGYDDVPGARHRSELYSGLLNPLREGFGGNTMRRDGPNGPVGSYVYRRAAHYQLNPKELGNLPPVNPNRDRNNLQMMQ